jgi:transglutaminase-like putative cysteine protease
MDLFKRHFSTMALLVIGLSLTAAEIKYPVNTLPDSLKANAMIVIRNWNQKFEIKSIGKGIETYSYAITILNENGLDYTGLSVPYSVKLQKVQNIKGTVYNKEGEQIESLTPDKLSDYSTISGYSLYEDGRLKSFTPKTMSYPFTVEYSCEIVWNGLLLYPGWQPVVGYNVSVEASSFTIVCPKNISFRYREYSLKNPAEIIQSDASTTFKWSVSGIVAMLEQPFSGPFRDFCPRVMCAPNDFEIEGFQGNMSSWKSMGNFISDLNKGRDQLPEETKALIREKVKNCLSDYEKAKVVYEYMQQKTRYLNITVGIGGWQPIPAETVDRLGYGDCKALSNYTKSLLNAAGIKAYYTLILAGKNVSETQPDFPSNSFNHAILCVPVDKDTLWLECTNQHMPFGFIGSFTCDRPALVITEDNSRLVHTRSYSSTENQLIRNTSMQLDATGTALLSIKSTRKGLSYEDKLGVFLSGTEDREKMILNEVNLPGAYLNQFDYQEMRSEVPAISEHIKLDAPRYATIAGARMIVALVPLDRQREVPKKVTKRLSDVIIRNSRIAIDTFTISIPDGYQVESIPGAIKTESRFGTYSLESSARDNSLICIRRIEMRKSKFPADSYNELVDFYKKVVTADNSKVILKKAAT